MQSNRKGQKNTVKSKAKEQKRRPKPTEIINHDHRIT